SGSMADSRSSATAASLFDRSAGKCRLTVSHGLRTGTAGTRGPDPEVGSRGAPRRPAGCRRDRGPAAGQPAGSVAASPCPEGGGSGDGTTERDAASVPRRPRWPRRVARVPRRLLGRGSRKLQGGGRARGTEEEVTVTATETIRKEIFVDAA